MCMIWVYGRSKQRRMAARPSQISQYLGANMNAFKRTDEAFTCLAGEAGLFFGDWLIVEVELLALLLSVGISP